MRKTARVRILMGDNRKTLKNIPAKSIHAVVTSPPYWGLRNYNDEGLQIGSEPNVAEYIKTLVEVFRGVRRALRDDGVVWLNLGDAVAKKATDPDLGFKKGDLIGLPWRVAFALQADGWFLRCDTIWHKPSGLPESTNNRPSKAHEYVFLISKSLDYFYDVEAAKVPSLSALNAGIPEGSAPKVRQRSVWSIGATKSKLNHTAMFPETLVQTCLQPSLSAKGVCKACGKPWTRYEVGKERIDDPILLRYLGTDKDGTYNGKEQKNYKDQKAQRTTKGKQSMLASMLTKTLWKWKANCSCKAKRARPLVLDPFGGAGTTAVVAARMGADVVLCELNKDFARIARDRVKKEIVGAKVKI
jgi:site-specific DNA-methyltransferase (cytosine-N4-specific)